MTFNNCKDGTSLLQNKSSGPDVFCKKDFLKNLTKFTVKNLHQSLQTLISACNFVQKETLAQIFSWEFCEMFKNTYFLEHFRTRASGRGIQELFLMNYLSLMNLQKTGVYVDIVYDKVVNPSIENQKVFNKRQDLQ